LYEIKTRMSRRLSSGGALARSAGAEPVAHPGYACCRITPWSQSKPASSFFRANFCRDRRTKLASLPAPENLYLVFRGDEMRPNDIHSREDSLFPDDASRPDLEALETAKARQDVSHQKLDKFIAAALAELSGEDRAA
jgi:hypothetical protein